MGSIALVIALISSCYLAGLSWTVHLVVYPAFALVGPADWPRYHTAHTRRILVAVGPMWLAEAIGTCGWIAAPPPGTGVPLAIAALAAAATVVLTGAAAVPAHGRLATGFDSAAWRALMRANAWRTAAWTMAAAASAWALVAAAAG